MTDHPFDSLDPETRELGLRWLNVISDRLGMRHVLRGHHEIGPGVCHDCGLDSDHRWRLSKLELCQGCTKARLRVRAQLDRGKLGERKTT